MVVNLDVLPDDVIADGVEDGVQGEFREAGGGTHII